MRDWNVAETLACRLHNRIVIHFPAAWAGECRGGPLTSTFVLYYGHGTSPPWRARRPVCPIRLQVGLQRDSIRGDDTLW